jgi:D-alanyl-lipoteichoic acid acyltransferase DltB (MBOAT superfamily)
MLFNSPEFIFLFVPIVVWGFFQVSHRVDSRWAIAWLVAGSLFFYGWWKPIYLILLVFSMGCNYLLGDFLTPERQIRIPKKGLLTLGIGLNLALIGYFKYANFFLKTVNDIVSSDYSLQQIILPLGISFFTFQQIAYLVDAYRGETKEYNLLNYCLFVSFFPQLIAGPIVHHKEILPQFANPSIYRFNGENLAVGLTIFSLGFFKKVIFADGIAIYANPVFSAATQGTSLTFFEAWAGVLAYSLQLYFDFSGYSDMAIGAARLFGIKLPLNFNSPYKAVNIIDFWRRWHITLSRFLREYVYIPLGGNRQGEIRRNINLMITMLLGGLWHGAGWTFVLWGGLHGLYLVVNQQWRSLRQFLGQDLQKSSSWSSLSRILMFLAVAIAWVFFRAENLKTANIILKGMFGFNGVSFPPFLAGKLGFLDSWGWQFNGLMPNLETNPWYALSGILFLLAIAWFAPNTQEWMAQYEPVFQESLSKKSASTPDGLWQKLQWQPNIRFGLIIGAMIFLGLKTFLEAAPSDFLYFNF